MTWVDEARNRAEEILSRDEFSPPEESFVERILGRVGDWLSDFFSFLTFGSGGSGVGTLLGWIIIVALVAFIAVVLLKVDWRRRRRTRSEDEVRTVTVAGRTAGEWDDLAAAAERDGRWSEAVRARYRAVVARLAGRGIVSDRAATTSGEHRVDVDDRWSDGRSAFDAGAERFDEVWYGGDDAGPSDSDRLKELARLADAASDGDGRG